MRNNSNLSKNNLSSSLSTSQIKTKNAAEPITNCCPLVTEKIIQVVPISLYSSDVSKPRSVKKDNDIKNLLLNSKSKSYIVTKNNIIPTCQYTKSLSNQEKIASNILEINNIKVRREEESGESKESSFTSNSKNSFNSRVSGLNKSEIPESITKRKLISEIKTSMINSEKGRRKESESLNDEEGENLSTNSVSDVNDGNMILDDFLILEEKLGFIKTGLKTSKNCTYLCWEWWNYSNYCEIKEKMDNLYKKQILLKDASILETLGIFVIYGISFDEKFSNYSKTLYNLSCLIYQNFLLCCKYYLDKITNGNYIINRTKNLVNDKLEMKIKEEETKTYIRKNNNNIFNSIRDILEIYNKKEFTNKFAHYLKNLQNVTLHDINEFFKENLLIKIEKNSVALIPYDNLHVPSKKIKTPVPPFIKTKAKKPYTLILDLDETMIHLKIEKNSLKGIVTFRPGLFNFLDEMSSLYELIVFTCGTLQYAEPIIDSIENKKSYFDHRLYRDHTQFVNGEYVKDLSMIGRDIAKCIIVDNIPQNFRLQKENGIFIKSFYSENKNDDSLIQLGPILKKIITQNPLDIRKEISKWKNDIVKKISTNLSSNNANTISKNILTKNNNI